MIYETIVWWVGWRPHSGSGVLVEVEGTFYIAEVGGEEATTILFSENDDKKFILSRKFIQKSDRLKVKSKDVQDSAFWGGIVGGGSLEHLLCDDLRAVIEELISILGDELKEARNED